MREPILEVNDLKTYFYTRSGIVKAVDGISFSLHKGKTLGIVGESGSGKSVAMMSIMGLLPHPPAKIEGGSVFFEGQDLLKLNREELCTLRGRKIGMIFQDPMTSLNPYLKISTQLTEALTEHDRSVSKQTAYERALWTLEQVGISDPAQRINQYPHQFSGGMRQRVMIAMALMTDPEVIIADEPTTALDVTIQAQILDILRNLQLKRGLSMILITHDLGVVAGMSDEVLVMYAGRPVEQGTAEEIFYRPHHPYTLALLRSIPSLIHDSQELYSIRGLPPDPTQLPPGCPFAPRCERAMPVCVQTPPMRTLSPTHTSVCHLEVPA
jgi:oligopeptide transport system ATP-binding protein